MEAKSQQSVNLIFQGVNGSFFVQFYRISMKKNNFMQFMLCDVRYNKIDMTYMTAILERICPQNILVKNVDLLGVE